MSGWAIPLWFVMCFGWGYGINALLEEGRLAFLSWPLAVLVPFLVGLGILGVWR